MKYIDVGKYGVAIKWKGNNKEDVLEFLEEFMLEIDEVTFSNDCIDFKTVHGNSLELNPGGYIVKSRHGFGLFDQKAFQEIFKNKTVDAEKIVFYRDVKKGESIHINLLNGEIYDSKGNVIGKRG